VSTVYASVCLGVDVGGSGTRAALARPDGTLIELRTAGRDALEEVLRSLAARVGDAGWVVHLGLAGLSRRGRRGWALQSVGSVLPNAAIEITHDAAIALWGALPHGEGLVVLAGTGAIAFARASNGREARAGGHGFLLGDDGSAFWLGREAVRASLAAAEGYGRPTRLTDDLARALGGRPQLGWPATREGVERLASLAPLVSQAAQEGDVVAREILGRAATALSALGAAAVRQVWGSTPPPGLHVATGGGVWQAGPPLASLFRAVLARDLPGADVVAPRLPPVGGALLLACRRAGGTNPELVDRLAQALSRATG
jgi:N-acetylglucosamine kinase-like BadF-type ATPase